LKKEDEQQNDDFEDEIKAEDGLVRHWMFFNGEEFRLFSGLAAAIFGVAWCFLYVLGAGQSIVGITLGVLTIVSLLVWWGLSEQLQKYAERGWRKDKLPPKRSKIEIRIAVGLWLFIFLSIGIILLSRWRHAR
jgi:hypothetical protein